MTRWVAIIVVAALLAAACTGEPPDSGSSTTAASPSPSEVSHGRMVEVLGATFTYSRAPDSDAVSDVVLVDDPMSDDFPVADRPVPLAFALRSCTDMGAGVIAYTVQWRAPDGLELPVTARLALRESSQFFGPVFDVTLEQDGVFTLLFDPVEWGFTDPNADDDGSEVTAVTERFPRSCELNVPSEAYVDDQTEHPIAVESASAPDVGAPDGALQKLAGVDSPAGQLVRSLLLQAGPDTDLFPDRLWLAPEASPEEIRFRQANTCWELYTVYREPDVRVHQARGCEADWLASNETRVQIEDPAWNVTVTGRQDDVASFIDQVTQLPVAGVAELPASGVAHEPLAEFEAQLAATDSTEIGRLPWGDDGTIIVWTYGPEGEFREFEAQGFTPDAFNAGGSSRPIQPGVCAATIAQGDNDAGFAVVIIEDPAVDRIEVERRGAWTPVELIEFDAGRLGLLASELPTDAPGFSGTSPPIRGFDTNGAELDCVSNR